MKNITINGREFQYETFESTSEWGESYWTEFYEGIETYYIRKWGIFGEKIQKTRPKHVFTIHEDANDPRLSKKWWWKRISKEIALLNRKDEVQNGNLTFKEAPAPNKKVYDKNKCPFPGQEIEWSDFCDWINRDGDYANLKEGELSFPKSFFLINRS